MKKFFIITIFLFFVACGGGSSSTLQNNQIIQTTGITGSVILPDTYQIQTASTQQKIVLHDGEAQLARMNVNGEIVNIDSKKASVDDKSGTFKIQDVPVEDNLVVLVKFKDCSGKEYQLMSVCSTEQNKNIQIEVSLPTTLTVEALKDISKTENKEAKLIDKNKINNIKTIIETNISSLSIIPDLSNIGKIKEALIELQSKITSLNNMLLELKSTAIIYGIIKDVNDIPIPDVNITISGGLLSIPITTKTTSQGLYIIDVPGITQNSNNIFYKIQAEHNNYSTYTSEGILLPEKVSLRHDIKLYLKGNFKIEDFFNTNNNDYFYYYSDYNGDNNFDYAYKSTYFENGQRITIVSGNTIKYYEKTSEGLKFLKQQVVNIATKSITENNYNCIFLPNNFSKGDVYNYCSFTVKIIGEEILTINNTTYNTIVYETETKDYKTITYFDKQLGIFFPLLSERFNANGQLIAKSQAIYGRVGEQIFGQNNLVSPLPTIKTVTIYNSQYFDFSTEQISNDSNSADIQYNDKSIIGLTNKGISSIWGYQYKDFEALVNTMKIQPSTPNILNNLIVPDVYLIVKTRENKYAAIFIKEQSADSVTINYVYPYGNFVWE